MDNPSQISTKRLVRNLNRKLSQSHQAVFRSERRLESSTEAYTFLDTLSGERRYLSFAELLRLAHQLGVVPKPLLNHER